MIRTKAVVALLSGLLIAGAFGLTGATGAASAAGPTQASAAAAKTKVSECGLKKPTARPRSLTMTCADAGVWLNRLHWRYWGADAALAVGRSTENDCSPTCAAGKETAYPVDVLLWRVKSDADGPQFTRATLTYTGKHAGRRSVTYTLRPYSPVA